MNPAAVKVIAAQTPMWDCTNTPLDRHCITIQALHQARLQESGAGAGAGSAGSAPSLAAPSSSTGANGAKPRSHHETIALSCTSEKAAVLAAACRQVATSGFEPVKNVFSLGSW
jgi:hypothetical protein